MSRVGRVLSDEPRWRCPVCTFLNLMSVEACKRCHERVDEEQRARLRLPVHASQAQAQAQAQPPAAAARARAPAPPAAAPKPRALAEAKHGDDSKESLPLSSPWTPEKAAKAAPSPAPAPLPKAAAAPRAPAVVHGLQKAKPSPYPTVKSNQFHKGDLGYTPKKANIHTTVQSKLNHDTASYRAKFEKDPPADGKEPAGSNIHTVSSTIRNGFVSSPAKRTLNKHDETPAPKPAKYLMAKLGGSGAVGGGGGGEGSGKRQSGLIGMLQGMASTGAVASLKHTEREVYASTKSMGTGYSKLAL